MTVLQTILSQTKLSEVYTILTGETVTRVGPSKWRACAPGGDNRGRISGDDSRGVWHDFVENHGGGVLDLVRRFRGSDKQAALEWLADLYGIELERPAFSTADRERWRIERKEYEADLPAAKYWQRSAASLAEEALHDAKSRLFDPMQPQPDYRDIGDMTGMLARLRGISETGLVDYYREWRAQFPGMTEAMVQVAKEREVIEVHTLCRFMGYTRNAASDYIRQIRSGK